jgi:hypothetical protein
LKLRRLRTEEEDLRRQTKRMHGYDPCRCE